MQIYTFTKHCWICFRIESEMQDIVLLEALVLGEEFHVFLPVQLLSPPAKAFFHFFPQAFVHQLHIHQLLLHLLQLLTNFSRHLDFNGFIFHLFFYNVCDPMDISIDSITSDTTVKSLAGFLLNAVSAHRTTSLRALGKFYQLWKELFGFVKTW